MWRSADEVPQGPGGRPLAFIAVNGHGAYPVAGTIPRIFYAVCGPSCAARPPTGIHENMDLEWKGCLWCLG